MQKVKQLSKADFPTNWDIDAYCTDYETDEHWRLKKRFMEMHKTKFPEQRLVCLAQVFTNMEFMGCKYPADTMRLVAELSKEVAKDYRAERSKRLKRTFVSAADAAESRAKKSKTTHSQLEGPGAPGGGGPTQPNQRRKPSSANAIGGDLFQGLSFGRFVLVLNGGRSCIRTSAQRSNMEFEEQETPVTTPTGIQHKVDYYLHKQLVSSAIEDTIKLAKAEAFRIAIETLQDSCYCIKPKPLRDTIKISKSDDNNVVCDVVKNCTDAAEEKKLDATNKGYKMMKMMGWTGGGLGSQTQGRVDPVGYLFKNNRAGLGNSASHLDRTYFQKMLQNYVQSEDIRELQFEPTFTKDERAMLHEIAGRIGLRSCSYGKGDNRRLIVAKKNISNEQILHQVLNDGNPRYMELYDVQVPTTKAGQFPEYTAKLELDL